MPLGDPCQDLLEVGLRVDAVKLRRSHERVDRCCPLAATIRTGEEIVASSERNFTHRVLGDVVVCLEPSVGNEAGECFTPLDRVAERPGERRLGRQLGLGGFGPFEERLDQRRRLLAVFNPLGNGANRALSSIT